jgi:hypothetical protein
MSNRREIVDLKLLTEELNRIFSSQHLEDLAREVLFVQRTSKLKPQDFIIVHWFRIVNHAWNAVLFQLCL